MMILLTAEEYRELQAMKQLAEDKLEWLEKYKESEDASALEFVQSIVATEDASEKRQAVSKYIKRPTIESFRPKL